MSATIPSEEQLARCRFLGDASTYSIAITNSSTGAAALIPGTYYLFCTKPFRFKQGVAAVAMSDNSTKGTPVPANFYFGPVFVSAAAVDGFITAKTSTTSDTGTLEILPVS